MALRADRAVDVTLSEVSGGVCVPDGYLAAGVSAGIKSSGDLDLALLVSDRLTCAAGVFTTNRAAAAPVLLSRQRVAAGHARGVVVNSGCANACTGKQGLQDAVAMTAAAAGAAGIIEDEMLVCSTGLIGSRLPMEMVRKGVREAAGRLSRDDGDAARAIMTTDKAPKRAAFRHETGWSIGGIAKGAGMIAPNMATMLALLTTDARTDPPALQAALTEIVPDTFNSISVDGDMSTNDTVLAFSNGASGLAAPYDALCSALEMVCAKLAYMMVADGEGSTKTVTVEVAGAADDYEARMAARAVAESVLVKTAAYGEDANWGRMMAAVGRSGARFDLDRVSLEIQGITLFSDGAASGPDAVSRARAAMKGREIKIRCDLGAGEGSARMLSCDLTPEYVRLNAAYEG